MASYQTTVASSALSLYELDGEAGPNLVAGLSFKHNYPHIPEILKAAYNSLAIRIHQAYNYGRDFYTYGLPDGYQELINDPPVSDVEAAIAAELGYPVVIHYLQLGEPDNDFFAEAHAQRYWGFRVETQVLHNPPIAPNQGYQVTFDNTRWEGNNAYLGITFNIGKRYIGGTLQDDYKDLLVPRTSLDEVPDSNKLYYHVRYTPVGATTPNHAYWIYEVGSGQHPTLDRDYTNKLDSPFLPVIPLRESNKNLGPEIQDGEWVKDENGDKIRPDTDLYRTSVRLCKKLDSDFDKLCLEIHKNPDISQIDHAYLIFGIDIRSEHKAGKQYLFDYFEDLSIKLPGAQAIEIKDAKYRVTISYSGILRTIETGQLEDKIVLEYSGDTMTLMKDLKNGTYVKVVVSNLAHRNYIYQNHNVTTTLSASADEDNYNFIVPVNIDIFNNTKGLLNRQGLLQEAYKLVFNSYERRKLKWYETGVFKFIMLVIAIVITIWSLGSAYQTIVAAYTAGGISAAISAAATIAITAYAVSTGVSWLASKLPPEVAIIVAIVIAALALSTNVGSNFEFATAENMLSITNAITDGIQQGITDELGKLQSEMMDFIADAEAASKELEELMKALDTSLDWFDAIIQEQTEVVVLEAPEEFYNRTVHAGNIGVASLSQIEYYVEKSLELPELTQI